MTTENCTMTTAQAIAIVGEVHNGLAVDEVTIHPYSGAATLSHRWKDRSYGRVIIDPDGTVTYRASDVPPLPSPLSPPPPVRESER